MNKSDIKKLIGNYSFTPEEINKLQSEVNSTEEIWKDIIGYEGLYQVSSFGSVKTLGHNKDKYHPKLEKIHKGSLGNGYIGVSLCENAKIKRFLIHRLVAQAFIPNPNNKPQVNHINGIKTDNRIENLEWATGRENMNHAYANSLVKIATGFKCHSTKLSSKDVLEIRMLYRPRIITMKNLATKFNVSKENIRAIILRKTFKYI